MLIRGSSYFDGEHWWYFFNMTEKNTTKDIFTIDKSTADLTGNPGFQSSLSIASKDVVTDDKNYNPFDNRQVAHPNTTFGSILHLLKACLGSGILAMPSAFKNSGLLIGTIGTLLAGVICTHTVAMVVKTSQEVCVDAKKPSMGYAETCGAAFTHGPKPLRKWGEVVRIVVDYAMTLTYFSVLCVYVVFIGSSFKEVMDVYYPNYILSTSTYCALTYLPLVIVTQVRNLKHLVPFSALANILIVAVFAITMYFIFKDLPAVSEREMVASVSQWPLFLSTVIFAMEGIGVVMPIENEMKNPQRFLGCPGVLNTAMIVVISLYAIFGFFGYLQFGDDVKGSITLNLPQEYVVAQVAKLLMAIVIFLSYALQAYVPMDMVTRMLEKRPTKYNNIFQIAIRIAMTTLTVAIAAAFPNLELVISLAGAIFFSTLGLLFPAIIDTVYNWDRGLGKFNYKLWKNLLICIISLVALISGSFVSIVKMIEEFGGNKGLQNHANETITSL